MQDLKIFYKTVIGQDTINSKFEKEMEALAFRYGLKFSASGVELGKGIRDIHYLRKKK